jgi:hypothetical protein
MACGYDPELLKPLGWVAPGPSVASAHGTTTAPPRPVTAATPVEDARPQAITDPDWVQSAPRRRLSYVATMGVVAAILVAVVGLVFVVLMVLNQPVGTAQADAMSIAPASSTALSVPAATASR